MPARLRPYSGSKQITSKSADPTSSYKYLEGSSFCPRVLSPTTTSLANSASFGEVAGTARVADENAIREAEDIAMPPHNGISRTRTDNAAGTSCGTSGAACTHRCAASRPSLHNVCRQKSQRSIRDKKGTQKIR